MSIVYLNGEYMPAHEAKISPMDRGFLFGDGIYEVVPSYGGQFVGFEPHMTRMFDGLAAIEIQHEFSLEYFRDVCQTLCEKNGNGNLGIYIHISRGTDVKRHHAYPKDVRPTLFAYTFDIPAAPSADIEKAKTYKVNTHQDLRWQRCNIKSTALLGNVMHYQHGHAAGCDETLLFNADNQLTEASSCNAFIVKDGVVLTPNLDSQKLPGITRLILLDILKKYSDIKVEERIITRAEVDNADEIWITSSTKQVGAVVELDGKPVNGGKIGPVWQQAQSLFSTHQFDYN
ncbi:MAG: D-amino acid aminotransferase [Gammaproteobacteria bacterium]|nr:D-amino acid aminotransferase [Gammaproteobacteria bacterium]